MTQTEDRSGIMNKKEKIDKAQLIKACFDLVVAASAYGGVVFGGFVRRIIVPMLYRGSATVEVPTLQFIKDNMTASMEVNDLDIWFKTRQSRDDFREKIGGNEIIWSDDVCGFASKRICYKPEGVQCELPLDLVVHPTIPVNNFDVNLLIFRAQNQSRLIGEVYFTDGFKDSDFSDPNCPLVRDTCRMIIAKTARMLPEYTEHLATYGFRETKSVLSRMGKTYDGWTISTDGTSFSTFSNINDFRDILGKKSRDRRREIEAIASSSSASQSKPQNLSKAEETESKECCPYCQQVVKDPFKLPKGSIDIAEAVTALTNLGESKKSNNPSNPGDASDKVAEIIRASQQDCSTPTLSDIVGSSLRRYMASN